MLTHLARHEIKNKNSISLYEEYFKIILPDETYSGNLLIINNKIASKRSKFMKSKNKKVHFSKKNVDSNRCAE